MRVSERNKKKFHGMRRKPKIGRPKKLESHWKVWMDRNHGGRHPRDKDKSPDLKERQKQILLYVRDFQYTNRYSPSVGQVAEFMGISNGGARYSICVLIRKGYLEADGRGNAPQILFPKGTEFPWLDYKQFPKDIFDPPAGYIPPTQNGVQA